jgi:hypothetical protein
MTAAHPEVPVKVTAWIDEGVVPLVVALNELDDVMTLDSCQGDATNDAYVLFCCRRAASAAGAFAVALAVALADSSDGLDYTLRAEWRAGAGEPLLKLSCPPDAIQTLADLVSACRMTVSSGDRSRTELHSSTGCLHHPRPAP